ncbi:MAG: outer membrane beta-barrel protein [Campylobacterota bacterium]|nr:outer membrane beta-barrel protein [Campylobacterota bacterium]
MKKITLSLVSVIALSGMSFAGGDFEPVVEPVVAVPVVVEDTSGFYLGAGLAAVSTRDATVNGSFFDAKGGQDRLGNLTFLAGYDFNRYIAAEGRFTTSIADEDIVEMSGWSLFAKPQYAFDGSNFKIYALLGFGGVTLDSMNADYVTDVDDTAFQWGIGAAYSFGEYMEDNNLAVFVDYTSLATDMEGIYWNGAPETDVDAITAGVTYRF